MREQNSEVPDHVPVAWEDGRRFITLEGMAVPVLTDPELACVTHLFAPTTENEGDIEHE